MNRAATTAVGHHASPDAPLLLLRGIRKRFDAVQALANVDLEILPGEVHAVVGENGAGKSTLMHVLCGVHQPDQGTISFDGQEQVRIADEQAAQRLGIAIVYQERSLFPVLSVAENVFAGRAPANFCGWIRAADMQREARALLAVMGLDVDPRIPVERLSPAHQQLVEIAKALSLRPRMILFDEPTAALTNSETDRLFEVIAALRREGTSVIYISHRLEEVFQIADRVTVMRDGVTQGTQPLSATSPARLMALMVGRELALHEHSPKSADQLGGVALRISDLADQNSPGEGGVLRGVNLHVRYGEIVALAGLAGAGRTEAALTVFGARPRTTGNITLDGKPLRARCVADAVRAGIGYVPEDRKDAGLFLEMSVASNIVAANLKHFGKWFISDARIKGAAESFGSRLGIVCANLEQAIVSLSGGNQQKALLARWLLLNPRVLIVDEPTRGVDVGAKAEVHERLRELARGGTAVLVISSDLPEVLALADRIAVMASGRITGELSQAEATQERIIHLASQVA